MSAFVGVNHYLDRAAAGDARVRSAAAGDGLLQVLGDLLGQAQTWGPRDEGRQILEQAESLVAVLECRLEAARLAVEDVRRVVAPVAPKRRS